MKTTITLAFLLTACPVYGAPPAQGAPKAPVKLTKSKICHSAESSPWYDKIKSPIATFKTVKDCLDSIEGAREPKRKKTKGGVK